jgi:hypothetical protein
MILLLTLCCWEDTVGGIPWVNEYIAAHFTGYCKYFLRRAIWIYNSIRIRLASFLNEILASHSYPHELQQRIAEHQDIKG